MTEYVVVWRAAEGAAVQTFAHPDKSPRVFTDPAAPEAEGADAVDDDGVLAVLLENREEFHPKRIPVQAARDLLGWSV